MSAALIDCPAGWTDYPEDAYAVGYVIGGCEGYDGGGVFSADSVVGLVPSEDHPGTVDVWAIAVAPGERFGFDGDYGAHANGLPVWVAVLWLVHVRGEAVAQNIAKAAGIVSTSDTIGWEV